MTEITINQEYVVKINATIETDLTNEEIENLIPTIPEVLKEMIIEEITDGVGTVDVEPVKRGKWKKINGSYYSSSKDGGGNVKQCSVCGEPSPCGFGTPYCAICGAKMDGESND